MNKFKLALAVALAVVAVACSDDSPPLPDNTTSSLAGQLVNSSTASGDPLTLNDQVILDSDTDATSDPLPVT